MITECPGCNKKYRVWIEGGHQYVEYTDIHNEKHKIHADTCRCSKKNIVPPKVNEGKDDGARV
jgi:hypothetical protein